jgi:hypothetical protein
MQSLYNPRINQLVIGVYYYGIVLGCWLWREVPVYSSGR